MSTATKNDSATDSKVVEKETICTQVDGQNLEQISVAIQNELHTSSVASLEVGRLFSIVKRNKMLAALGNDFTMENYFDGFGLSNSTGYLRIRVWEDEEVRELVRNGCPWNAADNILGIGSKYGQEYRDMLISKVEAGNYSTSTLNAKAQEIRQKAKDDKLASMEPVVLTPMDELAVALAILRKLQQERDELVSKLDELNQKIHVHNGIVKELDTIVNDMMVPDVDEPETVKPNATLAAAKLATEHDVNLAGMIGTLAKSRISVQDVRDEIASMVLDAKAKA